jgi:hypothetical protein
MELLQPARVTVRLRRAEIDGDAKIFRAEGLSSWSHTKAYSLRLNISLKPARKLTSEEPTRGRQPDAGKIRFAYRALVFFQNGTPSGARLCDTNLLCQLPI